MTLNLSADALRKARRLAELHDVSVEDAVEEAISYRLGTAVDQLPRRELTAEERQARLRDIQARVRRSTGDTRFSDHDLYDETGTPIL